MVFNSYLIGFTAAGAPINPHLKIRYDANDFRHEALNKPYKDDANLFSHYSYQNSSGNNKGKKALGFSPQNRN